MPCCNDFANCPVLIAAAEQCPRDPTGLVADTLPCSLCQLCFSACEMGFNLRVNCGLKPEWGGCDVAMLLDFLERSFLTCCISRRGKVEERLMTLYPFQSWFTGGSDGSDV